MKAVPWILSGLILCTNGWMMVLNSSLREKEENLQLELGALAPARVEAPAEPPRPLNESEQEELRTLRESLTELPGLRAQYAELKQEVQMLSKTVQQSEKMEIAQRQRQEQLQQLERQRSEAARAQMAQRDAVVAAAQEQARANACIANLKQWESAKEMWALENRLPPTAIPRESDLVGTYIRATPACPSGGRYTLGALTQRPTCSHPQHVLP